MRSAARLAITLVLCLLSWSAVARQEFWAEPAFADRPLRGAATAKGVVLYTHGNDDRKEEHKSPVQPYLRLLAEEGWDVIKFARLREADDVRRAEEAFVRQVGALKSRGYDRIVLAGPSRGGWLALMAATRVPVHAVIATAPGGFGTRNDGARRSLDELRARLPRILPGTRVFIADFTGDARVERVGGRAAVFRQALEASGVPYLLLDRPPGFTGHTSGMTGRFARVYGECLSLFVDLPRLPPGFSCATGSGAAVAADLPLPDGIASAPAQGMRGRWVGIYPNGDARLLVVTEDDGKAVRAVWSWAAGPFGKRERAPGYEWLSCSRSGETLACRRKAGLAVFTPIGANRLKYQWFPADARQARLSMTLARPGQW